MTNIVKRPHGRDTSLSPVTTALLVTCEHGGNRIPAAYRHLFREHRDLLDSHCGFDPGALIMARELARNFSAPLLTSTISRLLVDLNRSIGHRNLHMAEVENLPAIIRQEIVDQYYQPYRSEAERLVTQGVTVNGRVIHLSCHSFTNSLNGVVRHTDIGLLYDPARNEEKSFCGTWKSVLNESFPDLEVRRNFPYQGRNDGLTSTLRKKFRPDAYLGIELELNQKNIMHPVKKWSSLRKSVITSLEMALKGHQYNAGAAL